MCSTQSEETKCEASFVLGTYGEGNWLKITVLSSCSRTPGGANCRVSSLYTDASSLSPYESFSEFIFTQLVLTACPNLDAYMMSMCLYWSKQALGRQSTHNSTTKESFFLILYKIIS